MATPGRAGARIDARLDGLRELKGTLEALPAAWRETIAASIAKGAQVIEAEAKQRVRRRSGETAQSIGTNVRDDGLMAAVGSDLPHSRFLELGTSRSGKFPFLYPAFKRGAKLVRTDMRNWGAEAERKVRSKTKRYKPPASAK